MGFIEFLKTDGINKKLRDAGFFYVDFNNDIGSISMPLKKIGFSVDDMLSGGYRTAVHPDDILTYDDLFNRLHSGLDDELYCEYRLKDKNGIWQWVLTQAFVIQRNEDHSSGKIIGIDRIITSQKAAEGYLRTTYEETSKLLQMFEMIWNNDPSPMNPEIFLLRLREIIDYDLCEVYYRSGRKLEKIIQNQSSCSGPVYDPKMMLEMAAESWYPVIIDPPESGVGALSILVIPLRKGERLIGLAVLSHRDPGFYHGFDLYPLQLIAGVIAEKIIEEREGSSGNLEEKIQREAKSEVARELHDGVAQNLAFGKILTENLCDKYGDNSLLVEDLIRLKEVMITSLREVRLLTSRIRIMTEDANPAELMRNYISQLEVRYGVTIKYSETGCFTFQTPPNFNENLMRIAQEGISNAVRHSGAGSLEVDFSLEIGNQVRLIIRDHGRGLAGSREGNGMLGIRERTGILGGSVEWISGNDSTGTSMILRVPVQTSAHTKE